MYLPSQPVSQMCFRSWVVGTRGVGSRSPTVGTTQARPCTGTKDGWSPQATTMSFCQKEAGATSRLLAVVGARILALTVGSPRQSCNLESQRKLNSFHSNSLKPVAIFLYPCRSINESSTKYFPCDLHPSFLPIPSNAIHVTNNLQIVHLVQRVMWKSFMGVGSQMVIKSRNTGLGKHLKSCPKAYSIPTNSKTYNSDVTFCDFWWNMWGRQNLFFLFSFLSK